MASMRIARAFKTAVPFSILSTLVLYGTLLADPIAVRHKEGVSHGFLLLRTTQGRIIASGELIQDTDGEVVTTEVIFHFKDGSLDDETTTFTQNGVFRLMSDHLLQKGPSFPHPIDIRVDTKKKEVVVASGDNPKNSQIDFPPDISNGMLFALFKNLSTSEIKVALLAPSANPRLVNMLIKSAGETGFAAGGTKGRAKEYVLRIQIGGITGAIAPVIGKQPPDGHVWLSAGPSPTVLRYEGVFYQGGPIWRVDMASVRLSTADIESHGARRKEKP